MSKEQIYISVGSDATAEIVEKKSRFIANVHHCETEEDAMAFVEKIKEYCKYFKIKSRNIRENNCNLVIEVRVKEEFELVQGMKSIKGVKNVSLVSHDGEAVF